MWKGGQGPLRSPVFEAEGWKSQPGEDRPERAFLCDPLFFSHMCFKKIQGEGWNSGNVSGLDHMAQKCFTWPLNRATGMTATGQLRNLSSSVLLPHQSQEGISGEDLCLLSLSWARPLTSSGLCLPQRNACWGKGSLLGSGSSASEGTNEKLLNLQECARGPSVPPESQGRCFPGFAEQNSEFQSKGREIGDTCSENLA